MVSRVIACALMALSLPAFAELDLTPRTHVSELEGIKEVVTAFRNGAAQVTWQPPNGWRISGGGDQATLVPADATQAEARVELAGPPEPADFDQAFAKKLKQELTTALPPEVSNVEWSEDEMNPLFINGHSTYKVTFSYTLAAQRFTMTVWVCNFARQQLRFRLTARASEFSRLQDLFRRSLYTWQGLD